MLGGVAYKNKYNKQFCHNGRLTDCLDSFAVSYSNAAMVRLLPCMAEYSDSHFPMAIETMGAVGPRLL